MKLTETEIEIIDAKLEKLRGIYRERAEKLEALGLSENREAQKGTDMRDYMLLMSAIGERIFDEERYLKILDMSLERRRGLTC
jgi:hypothetical protein